MNYESLLATAALAGALVAQSPTRAPADVPRQGTGDWHTPFAAADDGQGFWAAGSDYKVHVSDGMTFYPRVGANPHQPWTWRTKAIRSGNANLLAGLLSSTAPRVHGQRIELLRGGVREVYDARRAGVEQTFVIERPEQIGDIEVVGTVSGALHAAACAAAHQGIDFHDAGGTQLVRYGAATAIDALGRRLPMTSSYADGGITLRIPAGWLATAAWPVTIDPLIERTSVGMSLLGESSAPQVFRADSINRIFVAEARQNAINDWDYVVRAFGDDWSLLGTVYTDLGGNDTRYGSLAYADSAARLLVATGRSLGFANEVRVYFHVGANLIANSGVNLSVPRPAGTHDFEPSIGGSSGSLAYLAFRRETSPLPANTANSRVLGALVDAGATTIAAASDLHGPGADYDAEHPVVSGYSQSGGWLTAWQAFDNTAVGDDWDVFGRRVSPAGALGLRSAFGLGGNSNFHKLTPHVAGSGDRYGATYVLRVNPDDKTTAVEGTSIWFQRLDWPWGGPLVTQPPRQIAADAADVLGLGAHNRALAYDLVTQSLWGASYQRTDNGAAFVARVGFDGGIAEAATLPGAAAGRTYDTSVCFDPDAMAFPLVFATQNVAAGDPVYGMRMTHAAATATAYGLSCAGSAHALNSGNAAPHAGSEFFAVQLTAGRANAPTVLIAGAGPTNQPLPSGGPGCVLLIDPSLALVVLQAGVSNVIGEATVPLPIPSTIGEVDVRWQFVQLDGAVLRSSAGLRTQIR